VTKPVFSDETGRRATVLLGLGRGLVTVSAVVGAALAFTLTTRIALPGLDGLLSPTLNGSQPEVAVLSTPDPNSDATRVATDLSEQTTTTRRARSTESASLPKSSVTTRRAVSSSTRTSTRSGSTTSPARPAAKPRRSHAAAASTAARNVEERSNPTAPGQTKKPGG
jgi:hypothetical protein